MFALPIYLLILLKCTYKVYLCCFLINMLYLIKQKYKREVRKFLWMSYIPQGASHGGSEKPRKLEVGGASRDSTGLGALEEGLISS